MICTHDVRYAVFKRRDKQMHVISRDDAVCVVHVMP